MVFVMVVDVVIEVIVVPVSLTVSAWATVLRSKVAIRRGISVVPESVNNLWFFMGCLNLTLTRLDTQCRVAMGH